MVADSTTDSQLFHGSPISRDVFKKRKANLLRKLKQCKVGDARLSQQWTQQWKRANVSEEENGCSRLTTLSDRFSQAWSVVDDDSDDVSAASSSPTSVDDDCFCCSKQVTEEEEASPEDPTDDKKKEDVYCPLCAEEMDATDLRLKPCSSCEYKICLFCYKKIIEEGDGVCPCCRTKYKKQQTSGNSGGVSFQQRRGGGNPLPLSSSFQALLDIDSD